MVKYVLVVVAVALAVLGGLFLGGVSGGGRGGSGDLSRQGSDVVVTVRGVVTAVADGGVAYYVSELNSSRVFRLVGLENASKRLSAPFHVYVGNPDRPVWVVGVLRGDVLYVREVYD